MKKIILSIAILFASIAVNAQNATKDASGNYVAIKHTSTKQPVKNTGKTFTDNKGVVYPVLESERGKLFYLRTSKTGNQYKVYLKVN